MSQKSNITSITVTHVPTKLYINFCFRVNRQTDTRRNTHAWVDQTNIWFAQHRWRAVNNRPNNSSSIADLTSHLYSLEHRNERGSLTVRLCHVDRLNVSTCLFVAVPSNPELGTANGSTDNLLAPKVSPNYRRHSSFQGLGMVSVKLIKLTRKLQQ